MCLITYKLTCGVSILRGMIYLSCHGFYPHPACQQRERIILHLHLLLWSIRQFPRNSISTSVCLFLLSPPWRPRAQFNHSINLIGSDITAIKVRGCFKFELKLFALLRRSSDYPCWDSNSLDSVKLDARLVC